MFQGHTALDIAIGQCNEQLVQKLRALESQAERQKNSIIGTYTSDKVCLYSVNDSLYSMFALICNKRVIAQGRPIWSINKSKCQYSPGE